MKSLAVLNMCLNWKVLAGLGLAVFVVVLFVPQFVAFAPLLLVLACPLSMLLMMRGMKHGTHGMKEKNENKLPTESFDAKK